MWIYGGTITATGGAHGAGIGAGEEGGNLRESEDGGGINILGGNVTATGGDGAPGIGGGYEEDMSGTIVISGDTTVVNATGKDKAAGIGSGSNGNTWKKGDMDGTVRINGGKVVVTGGDGAAGIGAGRGGSMSGGLFIMFGGDVEVTGGTHGAGIGGGSEGGVYEGGEGGTCYIGGGSLKVFPVAGINYTAPGQYSPPGTYIEECGEAIAEVMMTVSAAL